MEFPFIAPAMVKAICFHSRPYSRNRRTDSGANKALAVLCCRWLYFLFFFSFLFRKSNTCIASSSGIKYRRKHLSLFILCYFKHAWIMHADFLQHNLLRNSREEKNAINSNNTDCFYLEWNTRARAKCNQINPFETLFLILSCQRARAGARTCCNYYSFFFAKMFSLLQRCITFSPSKHSWAGKKCRENYKKLELI